MTEFQKKVLAFRLQFEEDKKQVLAMLNQMNALLDHALDPATPRDDAARDAEVAEALMERFDLLCDGRKPS